MIAELNAAEEAASRAFDLSVENGNRSQVQQCHHVLGQVYHSKGKNEMAIRHFEKALGIATSLNQHNALFWVHHALASLFSDEGKLDDAHTHIEIAKSHTTNNAYLLGRAMDLQASFLYQEHRFEEAKIEALRAVEVFEKLGAAMYAENTKKLLLSIEEATNDA